MTQNGALFESFTTEIKTTLITNYKDGLILKKKKKLNVTCTKNTPFDCEKTSVILGWTTSCSRVDGTSIKDWKRAEN